jgi:NAD(P)-dependent dehydrogenase (short-subunit alcohol dehydrogenase family)
MTVSQADPTREHDAVAAVLIIGASRGIGLETVKAALEAGRSVRALARSARRIRLDHPKLEKIAGDALEMVTVKRALTGALESRTAERGVLRKQEIAAPEALARVGLAVNGQNDAAASSVCAMRRTIIRMCP